MQRHPDVDAVIQASDQWPEEMRALRAVLLDAGLTEQCKWRKPCYAHGERNIAIMQEMKDFLALMFFKGTLIDDTEGVLHDQGPNSRSARRMQFTSTDDVARLASVVAAYVDQAVEIEESGREVGPPPALELVGELQDRLDTDPALRTAFDGLTPGRQREYNMHIAGAKQSATRVNRVEKLAPRILAGKGLRDR